MSKTIEHPIHISGRAWRSIGSALAVWALALCAVGVSSSQTPTAKYTVLHAFAANPDGFYPNVLVLDGSGNLYGITEYGGNTTRCMQQGCGGVYTVDSAGNFTVLHTFEETSGDGEFPVTLVRDDAGNLYGTTYMGGMYSFGMIFKLDASGNESILHNFSGRQGDGAYPEGGLILDAQGNLYGGAGGGGAQGYGALFKLDTSGNYSTLFSFSDADGASPTSLLMDAAGNFYGTTYGGGAHLHGAVFEWNAAGHERVLYSFTGGADGAIPISLLRTVSGHLIGAASDGGVGCGNIGCGVIFEVSPAGVESVLHAFTAASSQDGVDPRGLILGTDGNFYGTTFSGGTHGAHMVGGGTVFRLSPGGKESVIYNFPGMAQGSYPSSGLVQDAEGNFYGGTGVGGENNGLPASGVLFKFVP
jgi:uncharacterized repeat protein (TIGR03803 family)